MRVMMELWRFFSDLRDKMKDTNFLFGKIGTCSVDSERQHVIYESNARVDLDIKIDVWREFLVS